MNASGRVVAVKVLRNGNACGANADENRRIEPLSPGEDRRGRAGGTAAARGAITRARSDPKRRYRRNHKRAIGRALNKPERRFFTGAKNADRELSLPIAYRLRIKFYNARMAGIICGKPL